MHTHTPTTGILCAVLSALLMGTIGVFSKILGMPAETITFFRLSLGAFFMFVYLGLSGHLNHIRVRPSLPVCINGILLAGFIIFYVQAMNYTTMANAIMLVYLAPLTSSIFAHFFMNERLKPLAVILILTAILGFAMMLEFNLDIGGDRQRLQGLGLAVLAMLCYSGFILMNRIISDHVHCSTFYQLLTGGIIMAPFLLFHMPVINEGSQWIWLICVGFFPGFLAILFAVIALRMLKASTFGTLAYFEPLAVVLFGWILFNETLSALQISGCMLILSCGIIKALKQ